jgi:hypothetical protein
MNNSCLASLLVLGMFVAPPVLFILGVQLLRAFKNWEPPDPETTRSAREASYLMALMGMRGGPPRHR